MIKQTQLIIIINIVGGALVLGGYAWGLITHPETRAGLWGGIPESWKVYYTVSMFLAAAGYLTFFYYIVFAEGQTVKPFNGAFDLNFFTVLFATYLLLAAAWMATKEAELIEGDEEV